MSPVGPRTGALYVRLVIISRARVLRVDMITAAIDSTPVVRQLAERPAVVLERLPRGGGATRWYLIRDVDQLSDLAGMLTPGSAVSFYFDGRIERKYLDEDLVGVILDLVQVHGDAVVGVLSPDGVVIDVELVSGVGDLSEFLGATVDGTELFVGAFPGRDDDGVNAITLDLPDCDGVVRRHPH
jgi:hypothetical protein